jgi:hypothetical protein
MQVSLVGNALLLAGCAAGVGVYIAIAVVDAEVTLFSKPSNAISI